MKSTINHIEEQIYKIFENVSQKWINVSSILSKLDLSFITSKIIHKHPIFSIDSLIKLYLYRKIKGFYKYRELIRCLSESKDIKKLGFDKSLPSKRTFNDFLRKKLDKETKIILDDITEKVLAIATQKGKILDIQLVKKAFKEKKDHSRDLREAVKLIKRLVYPQIDLKIHHNAKFTTKDLLDVLVYICQQNDFANNGCETFKKLNSERKSPNGDTLLYHLSKFESKDEIEEIFKKIFDVIFNFAKKNYFVLRRRRVDIAIDVHNIPYYGDKSDDYVVESKQESGTNHFYSFLTCAIVVEGRRFTIDAIPIHKLDKIRMENLVDTIIKRAKSKVHIDKVYLDRGFNSARIVNVLKKNNVKFIMPMQRLETIKAWFDKAEDCKARVINNFRFGYNEKAFVNLVLVDDEEGIKRAFITNVNIPEPLAHHLFSLYRKRWSIETSYRNMDKDFKPRTTSKNYLIRLFYFLFTVCLYNLWVLVNICIGIAIHGKVPNKPIITAKMFVIVFYRVYADYG